MGKFSGQKESIHWWFQRFRDFVFEFLVSTNKCRSAGTWICGINNKKLKSNFKSSQISPRNLFSRQHRPGSPFAQISQNPPGVFWGVFSKAPLRFSSSWGFFQNLHRVGGFFGGFSVGFLEKVGGFFGVFLGVFLESWGFLGFFFKLGFFGGGFLGVFWESWGFFGFFFGVFFSVKEINLRSERFWRFSWKPLISTIFWKHEWYLPIVPKRST